MKYLLGVFLLTSISVQAQWASIANNQCVSFADVINSNLFVSQNSPTSSNKLLSKYDASNYFYLDPNNTSFATKANNQLLSKQDLTSAADSFNISYGLSGQLYVGWASSTSACDSGSSSPRIYVAHATSYALNSYFATNGFLFSNSAWYYTNTYSNAFHTSINANGYYYIDTIQSCTTVVNCTVSFYVDASNNYVVEATSSTAPNTNITVVGNLVDASTTVSSGYSITINSGTTSKTQIVGIRPLDPTQRNCTFTITSNTPTSFGDQTYSWRSVNKY
ncbi:MAG: hypothetical protein EO766_13335 [Hydrotalea sp. AMD]|uniref:hypothetical protein n=1 Tax=Hydrotalea sp. AMD TaxID=2501297 RepID=UPI0010261C2B|nr:hypothetical protein [Hydrotalea sp. AMD]RWZ86784.1 MAG: hypothetical protein EO766_13335 [Hydrotalea sp. AMD]